MPELAEENLAALVRTVMPPRNGGWIVQVVDNHDEACAIFYRNILRVHRLWLTEVYEAGLHSVLLQHPLSLRRVGSQILRRLGSRVTVDVWEARSIKRHKTRLSEKRSFLARTANHEGVAFGSCAGKAEAGALRSFRSAVQKRARLTKLRAQRDERYQDLLRRRLGLGRYDGGFQVPLANYESWLPNHLVQAFKHYEEGVPLCVIENEVVDLVPSLDDRQLADLIYRLDQDISRAEAEADDLALGRVASLGL